MAMAKRRGSSRTSTFSPSTAASPSQPIDVETTGLPMAHAFKIFSRVPPPIRSGTMCTAAARISGRTSSRYPLSSTPYRSR
jgi:hypothetical protein